MPIEMFLSIFAFAASVGELLLIVFREDHRKKFVFTVIFTALVVTSGVACYQNYRHEQVIGRIQEEILTKLSPRMLPFDQLRQEIHSYWSSPDVNTALFRLIEEGVVKYRILEFQKDAKMYSVQGYYADTPASLPQGSSTGRE